MAGEHPEPDPRAILLHDSVAGEPVLPALTGADGFVFDYPGAGFALTPLHQADSFHQRGEDQLLVTADRTSAGRLVNKL